ncbi:hypothetical protein X753_06945 [Mesorhizobium sp. LNJC399B00]|nr:hypothetical protein X753_06945 [Mesorhizobium sp. LNJC399B00]
MSHLPVPGCGKTEILSASGEAVDDGWWRQG